MIYTYKGILLNLKNEILTQLITWKNLDDIILSKIRQKQKDKYCMILLISNAVKFIETQSRTMGARGWERQVKGVVVLRGQSLGFAR